jgi:ABC-type arginine/histidine transport system permease subunit
MRNGDSREPSGVRPLNVLPLASVMVPDTITGSLRFFSSNTVSMAKSAALAFKVSKYGFAPK